MTKYYMKDIFQQHQYEVLNSKGEKTSELKWYLDIHRDGDWHRGVHIYIVNDSGEILLHKRSVFVHTYPNLWENSCGGHVDLGETSLETAHKETKEELGVDIPKEQFLHIGTIIDQYAYNTTLHGPCINNEFDDIFVVRVPNQNIAIKTSTDEVAETRWIPWQDLKIELETHPELHVPRGEEYKILLKYLEKMFAK